jgi:cytochrome P450
MALAGDLDLPAFDYTDPELRGPRFHEAMADLAGRTWLATSALGWLFVLDREAAAFFLRSRSVVFPSRTVAEVFGITEGPLHEAIHRNIITIEGADHRRLRNLVNPAFSARAADRLRPVMRDHLADLWAAVAALGHCEFVSAFAKRYPSLMIATVVGAPLEDAHRLHEWATWFQRQFDPASIVAERERIERAIVEFDEYARGLIERRRDEQGDDLVSTLLTATHEGDRLSEDECLHLVMNVLAGGVDTTQAQLAHGIRLFAEHPGQWELLGRTPELVGQAVEEILRFEPITPFTARLSSAELTHRGVTFPAGTLLIACALTANHDSGVYTEPDRFDIRAHRGEAKPLTFGAGPHYCLGAALARAELEEALAFLVERMPRLALDGPPRYGTPPGVYGLHELPIRFEREAAPVG